MSTLFIIFVVWSLIGAILWQIIILLPMAKNKPNGPLTKLDYIKAIPFGPIIWLTYLLTLIAIYYRKEK